MAHTTGFNPYQDVTGSGLWLADFLYRERLLEFAQDGSLHAFRLTFPVGNGQTWVRRSRLSGLDAAQEKLHGTIDAFPQSVGPREIHRPLPNHGLIESLHEFREMKDREDARDLTAPLALGENLPQQADRDALRPTHLWRTHRIHCARQNHCLPERPIGFHLARQGAI
jgi:hypothetical protein